MGYRVFTHCHCLRCFAVLRQTPISGRPYVKRFDLCHCTVSCLSVTLANCGQTVGWIKMPLGNFGMEVGLGPGDVVLDGDPAPRPKGHIALNGHPAPPKISPKGAHQPPPLSAHVYCSQTLGWIKMPLGTKIGLGPGHIVLGGAPALPQKRGHSSPPFSAHVYCCQTSGWIKMPLGTEVDVGSGTLC